jgi:hypothetical protein
VNLLKCLTSERMQRPARKLRAGPISVLTPRWFQITKKSRFVSASPLVTSANRVCPPAANPLLS